MQLLLALPLQQLLAALALHVHGSIHALHACMPCTPT
jgi:hypothetical protein